MGDNSPQREIDFADFQTKLKRKKERKKERKKVSK